MEKAKEWTKTDSLVFEDFQSRRPFLGDIVSIFASKSVRVEDRKKLQRKRSDSLEVGPAQKNPGGPCHLGEGKKQAHPAGQGEGVTDLVLDFAKARLAIVASVSLPVAAGDLVALDSEKSDGPVVRLQKEHEKVASIHPSVTFMKPQHPKRLSAVNLTSSDAAPQA
jgi:hypothetical protein